MTAVAYQRRKRTTSLLVVALVALVASRSARVSYSFTPLARRRRAASTPLRARRAPSTVNDPDPPTPPYEGDPVKVVDAATILPDWKYDRSDHPVEGQPWRRGDTDGCEDPIHCDWRAEAEAIIEDACEHVGAEIHGITWGMSQLIVSLTDVRRVEGVIDGPEIVVDRGEDYDEELGPDLSWNEDEVMSQEEFDDYVDTHPRSEVVTIDDPVNELATELDSSCLSAVAKCIQDSLLTEEDRLQILARHKLMLTAPSGIPNILETQKEFEEHRGYHVKVSTRDPWKSNRTLKGKLVARTALDILINVDGRLVTIPQNFVHQTLLDEDYLEDEDEDEDDDDDDEEEEIKEESTFD